MLHQFQAEERGAFPLFHTPLSVPVVVLFPVFRVRVSVLLLVSRRLPICFLICVWVSGWLVVRKQQVDRELQETREAVAKGRKVNILLSPVCFDYPCSVYHFHRAYSPGPLVGLFTHHFVACHGAGDRRCTGRTRQAGHRSDLAAPDTGTALR